MGATPEADSTILRLSEGLYRKYELKRVYYSAYLPVGNDLVLPGTKLKPPLKREHRIYQADWLMRYYHFTSEEIIGEGENLDIELDPKCAWALEHLDFFPVEVNSADYEALLRVPGIGVVSAKRIIRARRLGSIGIHELKSMGVVLKRARYFVCARGKLISGANPFIKGLRGLLRDSNMDQLTIFDTGAQSVREERETEKKERERIAKNILEGNLPETQKEAVKRLGSARGGRTGQGVSQGKGPAFPMGQNRTPGQKPPSQGLEKGIAENSTERLLTPFLP